MIKIFLIKYKQKRNIDTAINTSKYFRKPIPWKTDLTKPFKNPPNASDKCTNISVNALNVALINVKKLLRLLKYLKNIIIYKNTFQNEAGLTHFVLKKNSNQLIFFSTKHTLYDSSSSKYFEIIPFEKRKIKNKIIK